MESMSGVFLWRLARAEKNQFLDGVFFFLVRFACTTRSSFGLLTFGKNDELN